MKNRKLKDSFRYAMEGIVTTAKNERNMKIHLTVLCMVLLAGMILKISRGEWVVCVILFALVLAGELFNTAIEAVVDMVMPEENRLAKQAKDAAAGAVLVLAAGAAVIGVLIFVPAMLEFLSGK